MYDRRQTQINFGQNIPLSKLEQQISWVELLNLVKENHSESDWNAFRIKVALYILQNIFRMDAKQVLLKWMISPDWQEFTGVQQGQDAKVITLSDYQSFLEDVGYKGVNQIAKFVNKSIGAEPS